MTNVVMRFSFETKAPAAAFLAELTKLGITGGKLNKVKYLWTVTTDTRCLMYAEHLNRFISAVPDKFKAVAK
jgi:hypothetical protein